MTTDALPTRLANYIQALLPWAHGHQRKAITTCVAAIIAKQTGCQAALAHTQGHQEAAGKRLSRLVHNERLKPNDCAAWLCRRALSHVPRPGCGRFPMDWTSAGPQHLLVVSLVVGRRAVPIFWRASDQTGLKGRMKRYALAVVKRACTLLLQYIAPPRVRLPADRGFPDAPLFALLETLGLNYIIRVKGGGTGAREGQRDKLNPIRFRGHSRRRNLGRVAYCQSTPHHVWLTMSRARDKKGHWGIWSLGSTRPLDAQQMAMEYGYRCCCADGFREATWSRGFAQARIKAIRAWARLFALCAMACFVLTSLGRRLLRCGWPQAHQLFRRVASRRRARWERSLSAAVIALVQQDRSLLRALSMCTKLNLEATVANVS